MKIPLISPSLFFSSVLGTLPPPHPFSLALQVVIKLYPWLLRLLRFPPRENLSSLVIPLSAFWVSEWVDVHPRSNTFCSSEPDDWCFAMQLNQVSTFYNPWSAGNIPGLAAIPRLQLSGSRLLTIITTTSTAVQNHSSCRLRISTEVKRPLVKINLNLKEDLRVEGMIMEATARTMVLLTL